MVEIEQTSNDIPVAGTEPSTVTAILTAVMTVRMDRFEFAALFRRREQVG